MAVWADMARRHQPVHLFQHLFPVSGGSSVFLGLRTLALGDYHHSDRSPSRRILPLGGDGIQRRSSSTLHSGRNCPRITGAGGVRSLAVEEGCQPACAHGDFPYGLGACSGGTLLVHQTGAPVILATGLSMAAISDSDVAPAANFNNNRLIGRAT